MCIILTVIMSIQEIIKPLSSFVITGIDNDPQSGAILQVLAANGFQQKIEAGRLVGKTYRILHIPQSKDFTLEETRPEKDEMGNMVTKKHYLHFTIVDTPVSTTSPTSPAETQPGPVTPAEPSPQPVGEPSPEPKPEPKEAPAPTVSVSSLDILRRKLSQTPHELPQPARVAIIPQSIPTTPEQPAPVAEVPFYESDPEAWNIAQNIPLDAFLHPENYQWGNDASVKKPEHYPPTLKKLYDVLISKNFFPEDLQKPLKEIKISSILDHHDAS